LASESKVRLDNLDFEIPSVDGLVDMYTTSQVAKMVCVRWPTLRKWVVRRKTRPLKILKTNGTELWLWTDQDVEQVRTYKAKNYWHGGGRNPKLR
jgi:hypothetical protein